MQTAVTCRVCVCIQEGPHLLVQQEKRHEFNERFWYKACTRGDIHLHWSLPCKRVQTCENRWSCDEYNIPWNIWLLKHYKNNSNVFFVLFTFCEYYLATAHTHWTNTRKSHSTKRTSSTIPQTATTRRHWTTAGSTLPHQANTSFCSVVNLCMLVCLLSLSSPHHTRVSADALTIECDGRHRANVWRWLLGGKVLSARSRSPGSHTHTHSNHNSNWNGDAALRHRAIERAYVQRGGERKRVVILVVVGIYCGLKLEMRVDRWLTSSIHTESDLRTPFAPLAPMPQHSTQQRNNTMHTCMITHVQT